MKSFHFDLGNSTKGPIGFCARVQAENMDDAITLLKKALPEEHEVDARRPGPNEAGIEYICVYFNDKAITKKTIDEVNEVEA